MRRTIYECDYCEDRTGISGELQCSYERWEILRKRGWRTFGKFYACPLCIEWIDARKKRKAGSE